MVYEDFSLLEYEAVWFMTYIESVPTAICHNSGECYLGSITLVYLNIPTSEVEQLLS
jgi:hypothetical protein